MSDQEKYEAIAEALEVEVDELADDKLLEEYETWESVAVLTIIAFMNESLDKYPHASELRDIKTVGELLKFMS